MRAVLQRVREASVAVDGEVEASIGPGFLILLGIGEEDTEEDILRLAEKTVHLRIFEDETGKFNRSLLDIAGSALVVSQFTLFADDSIPPPVVAPLEETFGSAPPRLSPWAGPRRHSDAPRRTAGCSSRRVPRRRAHSQGRSR